MNKHPLNADGQYITGLIPQDFLKNTIKNGRLKGDVSR